MNYVVDSCHVVQASFAKPLPQSLHNASKSLPYSEIAISDSKYSLCRLQHQCPATNALLFCHSAYGNCPGQSQRYVTSAINHLHRSGAVSKPTLRLSFDTANFNIVILQLSRTMSTSTRCPKPSPIAIPCRCPTSTSNNMPDSITLFSTKLEHSTPTAT
jgi:hypothetical protein